MYRFISFLVACLLVANIEAFVTRFPATTKTANLVSLNAQPNGNDGKSGGGFMSGFMKNVDQQIDDFFNKRMGNGEVFYGKGKFNPSGKVEGDYNGMGLTDKTRIDMARARKEAFLEEREERRRAEAERRRL